MDNLSLLLHPSTTYHALFDAQHRLAIGVSQHQKTEYNLNFAAKDAQDFSNSVLLQKGGLYRDPISKPPRSTF